MRILYGIVGEGMGHATRSRVVLDHLLAQGHSLRVVVSGRAHDFLAARFAGRKGILIHEISGLHMVYEDNEVKRRKSVASNLSGARAGLRTNLTRYRRMLGDFMPELVISDFESWAWRFGRKHRIPVLSIDNMQIINRCQHSAFVTDARSTDFRLARLAVKAKLPGCYHYLVSSFFFPPVRKRYTSLVPPILRPEILAAERQPGDHVLVYQTADSNRLLVPLLRRLPYRFRVYGMNRDEQLDNVTLCSFSEQGFVDDLRTARGVIAGGGYSLMGEAVHLRVPMLTVPLVGQYEQELNARYLHSLGYGRFTAQLSEEVVRGFLEGIEEHQRALMQYRPRDNSMLLALVDEVAERVRLGEPRRPTLDGESLGDHTIG
jgi:uncharacterized protein (TIGR00661 family)